MNAQTIYEIQRIAGDLYRIGVISHDQRERLEHLATQNPQFAAAFRVAARTQGEERQERITALVGPPNGLPPPAPDSAQIIAVPASQTHGQEAHGGVYADAYRVVNTLEMVGGLAKGLGGLVLFAAVIAFLRLSSQDEFGFALELPMVLAGIVFGLLFLFIGVLISAQGQMLRASLDTAVSTATLVRLAERNSPS